MARRVPKPPRRKNGGTAAGVIFVVILLAVFGSWLWRKLDTPPMPEHTLVGQTQYYGSPMDNDKPSGAAYRIVVDKDITVDELIRVFKFEKLNDRCLEYTMWFYDKASDADGSHSFTVAMLEEDLNGKLIVTVNNTDGSQTKKTYVKDKW